MMPPSYSSHGKYSFLVWFARIVCYVLFRLEMVVLLPNERFVVLSGTQNVENLLAAVVSKVAD